MAAAATASPETPSGRSIHKKKPPPGRVQRVSEEKGPKNRVHLDLYTRAPELLVERLVGLGATMVGDPTGPGDLWSFVVLTDPEGNELCVCREVDDDVG